MMYDWEVTFKDSNENEYIYDFWKNSICYAGDCFLEVRKLYMEHHVNDIVSLLDGKYSEEEILMNYKVVSNIEDSNKSIDGLKERVEKNPAEFLPALSRHTIENKIAHIRQLTLEVTQDCNLRCKYCVYSGNYDDRRTHTENNQVMPFDVAHRSIDYFFTLLHSKQRTAKFNSPAIGFYGGETLMAFDLIKKCVEYVHSIKKNDNINFTITTNGTLMTNEMAKFFKANDFSVLISLDGPKEEHDKFRVYQNESGTFDRIWKSITMLKEDEDYFERKVSFAATISKGHDALKIETFFRDKLKNKQVTVSNIRDEENTFCKIAPEHPRYKDNMVYLFKKFEDSIVKEQPLSRFLDNLFGSNYYKFIQRDFIELDKRINGDMKVYNIGSNCFPGEKIFVDVEGTFFVCERVNRNFSTGDYKHGFNIEKIERLVSLYSRFLMEHCLFCEARRFCSLCLSHHEKGDGVEYNGMCKKTREFLPNALKNYVSLSQKNKSSMITKLYKKELN